MISAVICDVPPPEKVARTSLQTGREVSCYYYYSYYYYDMNYSYYMN